MIAGLPLGFAQPLVLLGLLSLPVLWWLLRLIPPQPRREHVGRYITHVEEFWVPNRYGGWRLIQRAHYVDQYRTSHLQICS